MTIAYYIFSSLCILASILPFIRHPHWFFRVWEFGRIQLAIIQLILILLGFILIVDKSIYFWATIALHASLIIHHSATLLPYTILYKNKISKSVAKNSSLVSIISVNVYQFNQKFEKLITLVKEIQPDILLTIESNQEWEKALRQIENDYPNFKKVPLENTYGIHFYTKLQVQSIKVNYFIAKDLPSIEARVLTKDGDSFTFFGVHPPPPSPTEEDTAKERDGELLAVGKQIKATKGPVIVVGDFNNVAWAQSSILFRKTSELIDPRIGRGFVSTYHAKYRFLRFPIDLFFHSSEIFIKDFKTLKNIGSDHLPLYCSFFIDKNEDGQEENEECLEENEKEEVNELIEEGKKEESNRPSKETE